MTHTCETHALLTPPAIAANCDASKRIVILSPGIKPAQFPRIIATPHLTPVPNHQTTKHQTTKHTTSPIPP